MSTYPFALIPGRAASEREPSVRIPLGPGDEVLVEAGERVQPDTPLVHRPRHPQVAEQPLGALPAPEPGTRFSEGSAVAGQGRHALRFDGPGEVLYATPAGRLRAIVSRHRVTIGAPAAGMIASVDPCAILLRPDGPGLRAAFAIGEPSHGPLSIAVESPELELHAHGIDVRHAGTVLVAGSRVDVEGLTRARAMGVRGVIVGGLIGGDVVAFRASLDRQDASVHASPPFAVVILDAYGKRPIPPAAWEALVSAAGTDVGLSVTPPLVVLDAGSAIPVAGPDRVWITSGPLLGRPARVLGPAGFRRQRGGVYRECVRVVLEGATPAGMAEVAEIPLADLEHDG